MNRKISYANDICYIFMEVLLMSVLYLLPQAIISKKSMSFSGIMIIGLLAVIDYLLKMHCRNFILFLAGHFMLIPFLFLMPFHFVESIALTILAVILLMTSIEYWKTEIVTAKADLLPMPLMAIILFIAIEIISRIFELNQMLNLSFFSGLAFIFLYFIRLFLSGMLKFMYQNENSKNTPFGKIFLMNGTGYGVLFLSAGLLIILANISQTSRLFIYIWYGLKAVLIRLFRLIPTSREPDPFTPSEMPEVTPEINQIMPDTVEKVNPVVDAVTNVIGMILLIAAVLFLLYSVYRIIKALLKRYQPKSEVIEYTESIESEKSSPVSMRKFFTSLLSGLTNNQKIRKIYTKKVKGYQKSLISIAPCDTPQEINDKISIKLNKSMELLTDLYEQARYGEKELTKEDVEKAKDAK